MEIYVTKGGIEKNRQNSGQSALLELLIVAVYIYFGTFSYIDI